jgi:hypothetical protein
MAQYGIIRKVGTSGSGWVFTPPSGSEVPDSNFVHLLNHLASLGWRVVVAGDFLGTATGDELILEKS